MKWTTDPFEPGSSGRTWGARYFIWTKTGAKPFRLYCVREGGSQYIRVLHFATLQEAQDYAEALEAVELVQRRFDSGHGHVVETGVDVSLDVLVYSLCAELDRRGVLDFKGKLYRDAAVRPFVAAALGSRSPAWTGWPRRGTLGDAVRELADMIEAPMRLERLGRRGWPRRRRGTRATGRR
jgi:hypothetical protein